MIAGGEPRGTLAAVSRGAAATWIASATVVVAQLLTLRWAWMGLGPERFGAVLAMASATAYLGLSDLGLGLSLVNATAAANAAGDRARLERLLSTGVAVLALVAVFLGLAGVAAASAAPLARWLSVAEAWAGETRAAAVLLVVMFAARLPLVAAASVSTGLQGLHRVRLWQATGHLLQIGFALAALRLGGGMPAFAAAIGGGPLAGLALAALDLARRGTGVRLRARSVALREAADVARPGLDFFVLQLAGLVILGTDNVVVALRLGAEAVPGYAIPFQIAHLPGQAIAVLAAAAWPVLADRAARGDADAVRSTVVGIVRASVALAAGAGVIVLAFGREIARLWMGAGAPFDGAVLALAVSYAVLNALEHASAVVLNATGRTRAQARWALAAAALNLALSWTLAPILGPAGVALGTLVAAVATTSWFLPLAASRACGIGPRALAAAALGRWLAALPALAALAALAAVRTAGRPIPAAGAAIVLAAAWLGALALLALSSDERSRIRAILRGAP